MNLILKTALLLIVLLFTACDHKDPKPPTQISIFDPNVKPIINGNWYKPKVNTSWQIQLQKEEEKKEKKKEVLFNTSYDVELYEIDLFDIKDETIKELKKDGRKIICYFSAGTYEDWRSDAETFDKELLGKELNDWEGEQWLDIRNEKLAPIMIKRLDIAKQRGCDGVDPDNVNAYQSTKETTGFNISENNQLAYNKFLANEAHKRGLSITLKNDLEQIKQLVDYFDFSVNEECLEQENCEYLEPFISQNKAVLNIEYKGSILIQACNESYLRKFNTLFMNLALNDEFRYACPKGEIIVKPFEAKGIN